MNSHEAFDRISELKDKIEQHQARLEVLQAEHEALNTRIIEAAALGLVEGSDEPGPISELEAQLEGNKAETAAMQREIAIQQQAITLLKEKRLEALKKEFIERRAAADTEIRVVLKPFLDSVLELVEENQKVVLAQQAHRQAYQPPAELQKEGWSSSYGWLPMSIEWFQILDFSAWRDRIKQILEHNPSPAPGQENETAPSPK